MRWTPLMPPVRLSATSSPQVADRSRAVAPPHGGTTSAAIPTRSSSESLMASVSKDQNFPSHIRGDAFELIVKSKDRCTPCGCHHDIYILAPHRNPKDEDRPAAWHPGRGARFLDRMSRGAAPKTRGSDTASDPATPQGCRAL